MGSPADGSPAIGADGGGDVAAPAACPPQPSLDLAFATPYQRELIEHLSGEAEVEPGLVLPNRATPANRAAAGRYLQKALAGLGLDAQRHTYATGANVFARVGATTGSGEHVVLGAHFDTVLRSPGANDNATGVALVLAVGSALSTLPCRSKTVLLVLFDEEEDGLVGSKAFARKLVADQTPVHSVHTADQLGWDGNGDRMIELERPDPGLRDLYEQALRGLGLDFRLVTTTTSGSDHTAFRPTFRAVGLTEGYASGDTTPHFHRATDTAGTVDFAYLHHATTLVARTMADLVR
jgi:Zn-dependent M28 family amino/carboxypeptidase